MGVLARAKKQEKKNPRTIPFSREKIKKITSYIVFSLIIISIFFNLSFISKYNHVENIAIKSEKNMNDSIQEKKKSTLLAENAAVIFAQDFLTNYINIPQDQAQREQRTKDIKKFYIKEFTKDVDDTTDFKGERKVKKITYLEREVINSKVSDFHFLVDYDVKSISVQKQKVNEGGVEVEKDVETPHASNRINEVILRIATDGKGFAVADIPKMLDERKLNSSVSYQEEKSFKHETLGSQDKQKLVTFLNDYFVAFSEGNIKQLSYMTYNPQSLKNYKFVSIAEGEYSKIDDSYFADITVSMQEKESNLQVLQHYKFKLIKKNGDFFIKNEQ